MVRRNGRRQGGPERGKAMRCAKNQEKIPIKTTSGRKDEKTEKLEQALPNALKRAQSKKTNARPDARAERFFPDAMRELLETANAPARCDEKTNARQNRSGIHDNEQVRGHARKRPPRTFSFQSATSGSEAFCAVRSPESSMPEPAKKFRSARRYFGFSLEGSIPQGILKGSGGSNGMSRAETLRKRRRASTQAKGIDMALIDKIQDGSVKIALIGLGYVGLPLAVEFGKKFDVVGFDVKQSRLDMIRNGVDETLETDPEELRAARGLRCEGDPAALRDRDVFIITAPTPVDKYKRPDLRPLLSATETVGAALGKGALVVYESTVYPGCTEEECVPILEKASGLKFNEDFFCGYSPERINPGDKNHALKKIKKITSGSTPEAAKAVDALYRAILSDETYPVRTIKIAEAAKAIENAQRDLNIAFVNELSKLFRLMGLDTEEVLEAARTKWNFLDFRPGLVGGHCIGVDPYYLTHKAQELGYLPEVILAGRRINDGMGRYVASEVVKLMIRKEHRILGSRVLQLGVAFKENCPDIRNSQAVDVVRGLQEFGCEVDILDPLADPAGVLAQYGLKSVREPERLNGRYDAIVLAVAHRAFFDFDFEKFKKNNAVVFDVKSVLPKDRVDGRL